MPGQAAGDERLLEPALATASEAWLLGRARELLAALTPVTDSDHHTIINTLDELLAEARRRCGPTVVATLLRAATIARLTNSHRNEVDSLLDELLAYSQRHGLALYRADAHALRGQRLVMAEQEDAALTEIARALAISEETEPVTTQSGLRDQAQLRAMALTDCWTVLNQLGTYEAAEEVLCKAHQAIRAFASPHDLAAQLICRVTMLLGWGLRLERAEEKAAAREKFDTAAAMALAAEEPFAESLFPHQNGIAAVEHIAALAAAPALADPNEIHVARLTRLAGSRNQRHEQVIIAIALARSLEHANKKDQAIAVLDSCYRDLSKDHPQHSMRLNLAREIARLTPAEQHPVTCPFADYAQALETRLWSLRKSQLMTLHTRREHERLAARHGVIAQQALQDPLTGVPNRRALDEHLRILAVSTAGQSGIAVALIDLDRFKDVNDRHSHAEGDGVLRVVAATLREALRGDDIVARYGGDEFVVLLPAATVHAARQALSRAVGAVAALPAELSHGVTLSAGLVAMRPQEPPGQVLARADAAMYAAKRNGGNQIVVEGETPATIAEPTKQNNV